jgi:hypothetical protein
MTSTELPELTPEALSCMSGEGIRIYSSIGENKETEEQTEEGIKKESV